MLAHVVTGMGGALGGMFLAAIGRSRCLRFATFHPLAVRALVLAAILFGPVGGRAMLAVIHRLMLAMAGWLGMGGVRSVRIGRGLGGGWDGDEADCGSYEKFHLYRPCQLGGDARQPPNNCRISRLANDG